jgi:hypothetical protein
MRARLVNHHYVPTPLPPGYPAWVHQMRQNQCDWLNDANTLRRDWLGLPPLPIIVPFAQLKPLAITDGRKR